jgi:antibiotic biosynthesis monooxygenase (ABM) superfamily enzyme
MNRRRWLKSLAWLTAGGAASAATLTRAAAAAADTKKPIVLYCDLAVSPDREQEMLDAYHKHFKPVAQKHPGYIDLKMLKLRKVIQGGPAPAANINYRFQLTYESEALRQQWIASPDHAKYWPMIENTVADKGYLVLLTDAV